MQGCTAPRTRTVRECRRIETEGTFAVAAGRGGGGVTADGGFSLGNQTEVVVASQGECAKHR